MRTAAATMCLFALCLIFPVGCPKGHPPTIDALGADYEAQLPPGQLALRKVTDPKAIPDFSAACADTAGLSESIANSIDYLGRPSSKARFPYGQITHAQALASLKAFMALLDSGMTPAQMNDAIRRRFDVYVSVGCDNRGSMLFTGYYTPIFDASGTRTDRFRYPLYSPPAGMVKNPEGAPVSPMPDRRAIETSNMYAGSELVWLADPFEAYVTQIQGSARLHMTDGKEITVGYAANNGYEYKSVRAEMVKDGKIEKYAGLQAMISYFRAHPNEVTQYTWRNPRYVFFTTVPDGRPRGSLGAPVTTRRTIATDKKIFPPACLAFVAPSGKANGEGVIKPVFACDQDTGGAIRAAGRCDLYLGVGKEAGDLAGRTLEEGKLYYVFLKAAPAPSLAPVANGRSAN